MTKAIFLDYTGTVVSIEGADMKQMLTRILKGTPAKLPPEKLIQYWFASLNEFEEKYHGESYMTEDDLVYKILERMQEVYGLEANFDELHDLNQHIWRTAGIFPDVRPFFEGSRLPLYVLTNNTASYVGANLKEQGILPAGIISADDVRAFKPHREIFEEALKRSGCRPEEALHIGDSLQSDVIGASALGIPAVLLDRKKKYPAGSAETETADGRKISYRVIHSLNEM